jgi:hypothetical protein
METRKRIPSGKFTIHSADMLDANVLQNTSQGMNIAILGGKVIDLESQLFSPPRHTESQAQMISHGSRR